MNQKKLESLLYQLEYELGNSLELSSPSFSDEMVADIRKAVKEYKGDVKIYDTLKLNSLSKAILKSIELQRKGDTQFIDLSHERSCQYFGIGVDLEKLTLKRVPTKIFGPDLSLFPFAKLSNCNLFPNESVKNMFILKGTKGAEQIYVADEVNGEVSRVNIGQNAQGCLDGIFVAQRYQGSVNGVNVGLNAQDDIRNVNVANFGIGKIDNIRIGDDVLGSVEHIYVANGTIGLLSNVSVGNNVKRSLRDIHIGKGFLGNIDTIKVGSGVLGDIRHIYVATNIMNNSSRNISFGRDSYDKKDEIHIQKS